MLDANRLPRSPRGDPVAAEPRFEARLERAPELFAGFVIRLNI
jgi:hypothetical protein